MVAIFKQLFTLLDVAARNNTGRREAANDTFANAKEQVEKRRDLLPISTVQEKRATYTKAYAKENNLLIDCARFCSAGWSTTQFVALSCAHVEISYGAE